jgi:hypothetical protein
MHSRLLASAALICLAISAAGQALPPAPASQVLGKSDPAREERLKWFRDAKYGLFIHWGLYAVPRANGKDAAASASASGLCSAPGAGKGIRTARGAIQSRQIQPG